MLLTDSSRQRRFRAAAMALLLVLLAPIAACSTTSGASASGAASASAESAGTAASSSMESQGETTPSADAWAFQKVEAPDGHVVTDDFEFDIPEYWRGKVDVALGENREGFPSAVIYLKGHDEQYPYGGIMCRLVTVSRRANVPGNTDIDGDIGNYRAFHKVEGDVYVDVWVRNWPWMAWFDQKNPGKGNMPPLEVLQQLVDLSTGGALTYDDALASEEAATYATRDYLRQSFGEITIKGALPADQHQADAAVAESYRKKLQELVDRYGAPAIKKADAGCYLGGVAYARLADFGAGRDYLLVAYLDPARDDSRHPGGMPSSYALEVWDAGADGSNINLLYSGEPVMEGQNVYCTCVSTISREGRECLYQFKYFGNRPPMMVPYGLLDDGTFGELPGDQSSAASTAHKTRLGQPGASEDALKTSLIEVENTLSSLGVHCSG